MKDFKTVEDILRFAITLEQASQEFYRKLSQQTESLSVRHFLLEMVTEEVFHENQLRRMAADGRQIVVKPVSSQEVGRYIDAMTIPEPLDYKEAVKVARDKEKASRMLYILLSGIVDQLVLADVFRRLALQEKIHQDYFDQEYRRICIGEN